VTFSAAMTASDALPGASFAAVISAWFKFALTRSSAWCGAFHCDGGTLAAIGSWAMVGPAIFFSTLQTHASPGT
jgi:hypothetical protein